MRNMIDKILDRYFSNKLILLAKEHFCKFYGVSSGTDKVLDESYVWVGKNNVTLTGLRFKRSQSFIVLNRLLNEGWTKYDTYLKSEFEKLEKLINDRNTSRN